MTKKYQLSGLLTSHFNNTFISVLCFLMSWLLHKLWILQAAWVNKIKITFELAISFPNTTIWLHDNSACTFFLTCSVVCYDTTWMVLFQWHLLSIKIANKAYDWLQMGNLDHFFFRTTRWNEMKFESKSPWVIPLQNCVYWPA